MNSQWLAHQNELKEQKRKEMELKICETINKSKLFEESIDDKVIKILSEEAADPYLWETGLKIALIKGLLPDIPNKAFGEKLSNIIFDMSELSEYSTLLRRRYEQYLDSEPVEFYGDIIITDPCYLVKNEDWDECEYGEHMERLGFNKFMSRDTLYGDWSCTTYNSDTKEAIGEFCADAGMVCVMPLDDVLNYNPGFDYHTDKLWTTTLIKDFHGEVRFVINEVDFEYEGEQYVDYEVRIVGNGFNIKTGKPINFETCQTGL